MNRLIAGLDLGSTGIKVLVADEAGREVLIRQRPTPWRDGSGGATTLHAEDLIEVVRHLLDDVARDLPATHPDVAVAAVAVSGMGETGFLVTPDGAAAAPAFAWFDPRGAEQVAAFPEQLRSEFAGRTGLPWGVQVSVAKILHLRDGGLRLDGLQWLNLPEFVVEALGGTRAAEYSLASRTGLLDQSTGQPWPELLEYLGATPGLLPPLVDAGTPLGHAVADGVPAPFAGAALTVAGHDHLVSSVADGEIPPERYHVSMGTAEVLLRVVDDPLDFDARTRLGDALVNCVRHVVPGKYVLVAGVKTGLLMRRALQMFGISDAEGRDRLEQQLSALETSALAAGAVEVTGARNDDGVLRLTVRSDGITPAEVFNAILEHGNDEIRLLVEAMDREVPPATAALLTGGWAGMPSVARARARVLPDVRVSQRSQDTAYGATRTAAGMLARTTDQTRPSATTGVPK